MSERGSFCTEYIHCDKCFEACKQVLLDNTKYLNSLQIHELPIIAGKIGGMCIGEELFDMENEYIPAIQESMCDGHKIRLCVHSDCKGSVMYEFTKQTLQKISESGEEMNKNNPSCPNDQLEKEEKTVSELSKAVHALTGLREKYYQALQEIGEVAKSISGFKSIFEEPFAEVMKHCPYLNDNVFCTENKTSCVDCICARKQAVYYGEKVAYLEQSFKAVRDVWGNEVECDIKIGEVLPNDNSRPDGD